MPFIGAKPATVPLTSADLEDNIITSAKIVDGAIVNADVNASAAIAQSKLSGSFGITEADQWRLASNFTSNNTTINTGWERNDTTGYAKIGTGMTESSGIFTFATTGIYWIHFKANVYNSATSTYLGIGIETTPDNSTYTEVANSYTNAYAANAHSVVVTNIFFDVTDTSTHKVRFTAKNNQSGTNTILSNTSKNITDVTFLRLGDT